MSSQLLSKSTAAASLFLLCTLLAALLLSTGRHPLPDRVAIGQKIRPFDALSSGGTASSRVAARGRKMLLLFFSAGCLHCRSELRNFDLLYAEYGNKADMIGISVDRRGLGEAVQQEMSLRFPILFCNAETLRTVFSLRAVPALYLLDESNVLRHCQSGQHSYETERDLVEHFLSPE